MPSIHRRDFLKTTSALAVPAAGSALAGETVLPPVDFRYAPDRWHSPIRHMPSNSVTRTTP